MDITTNLINNNQNDHLHPIIYSPLRCFIPVMFKKTSQEIYKRHADFMMLQNLVTFRW